MNIAVLLTCFNRKEKTLGCLQSMFHALDCYSKKGGRELINLSVYLTDDGCTDGTADAVIEAFSDKRVRIIQGTGALFWAGGMRLAWSEAYKGHREIDFYLLLNDDTNMHENAFSLLLQAHEYSITNYGVGGIYTGATCAKEDINKCTYGGAVWVSQFKGLYKKVLPINIPQKCDLTNANILLVASEVVDRIGFLCEDYQHGLADFDYAIRANRKGIPVLLTAGYCGACDYDHISSEQIADKVIKMSLSERKKYFNHPVHSNKDYMRFIRNTSPVRLPMVWLGRQLNLYFPKLYYKLSAHRSK